MKLKIINPDYGMTSEQLRYREEVLAQVLRPDTEISMECLTKSRVCIDSQLDIVFAGPEIVSMAKEAEQEGYDGVVLYCLSDPAIHACREALSIPVVGGGQAAFLVAASLGYTIGLLTTGAERIPEKWEFVRGTGVEPNRLASIQPIDLSLFDIRKDIDQTIDLLVEAGRKAVEHDGAQVLILGCLSFFGMADEVSRRLGVPVVDPAFAVVSMAESLCMQKLSHSKKAYPYPPKVNRDWDGGKFNL